MRIKSNSEDFTGVSDDIKPNGPQVMHLIPGKYMLETFSNKKEKEQDHEERVSETRSFNVIAGKTIKISMPYYLPYKKKKFFIEQHLNKKKKFLARNNRKSPADNSLSAF